MQWTIYKTLRFRSSNTSMFSKFPRKPFKPTFILTNLHTCPWLSWLSSIWVVAEDSYTVYHRWRIWTMESCNNRPEQLALLSFVGSVYHTFFPCQLRASIKLIESRIKYYLVNGNEQLAGCCSLFDQILMNCLLVLYTCVQF